MEELKLNGLRYLHLMWVLPVLVVFFAAASHWKKKLLERFADAGIIDKINIHVNPVSQRRKMILVILSAALIIVALARPAWEAAPEKIKRTGRDVVFLLDVSSSMRATDVKPDRLELAKFAILDTLDIIGGDRVALLAFAGNAVIKCPLTFDYGFFRTTLEDLDADSVSKAGTRIGDAIRVVNDRVFRDKQKEFKDIILITDGEDHESFPVNAAEDARKAGVRIIVIGLGEEKGSRIPIKDERGNVTFLKDAEGEYVYSGLDWKSLRKIAHSSKDGRAYRVGTGETLDLASIYEKLIGEAEKGERGEETIKRYSERFQPFLVLAFFLLCLEMVAGERKRR